MPSGPKKRRAAKRKQPSTSLPTTFSFSPESESPPAEDLFSCVTVSASKDNDDVFSKGGAGADADAGVLLINDYAKGKEAGLKGLLSSNSVTSVVGGIVEPNQKDVDLNSVKDHQIFDAADAYVSRVLEETSEYDDSHTVLAGKCNDDVFSQGVADATVLINEAEGKAAGLKGLFYSNSVASVSVTVEPIQKDMVDADLVSEHETFVADVMEDLNSVELLHQIVDPTDAADVSRVLEETFDSFKYDESNLGLSSVKHKEEISNLDVARTENENKFKEFVVDLIEIDDKDTNTITSMDDAQMLVFLGTDVDTSEQKKQHSLLNKSTNSNEHAQNSSDDLSVTDVDVSKEEEKHLFLETFSVSIEDVQNIANDLREIEYDTLKQNKQSMSIDKFTTSKEEVDLHVTKDNTALEKKKQLMTLDKLTTMKNDAQEDVTTEVEKNQLMPLGKFNTLEEDPQDSNDDLRLKENNTTLEEEKNCYLSFEKCTGSKQDGKILENPVYVEIVSEPNQSAGHAKSPDLPTNVQPLLEGMWCGCNKCCLVRTLSEIECGEEKGCNYGTNLDKIKLVKEIIEGELKAIEKLSLVLNMALGQLSDV